MKAGWRVVPLADVCTVVNGGTPKSNVATYWGGDVNWLTPKDMGQMTGRHIAETPRKITAKGLDNCSARLVPAGSVIMSTRAPIGHLAINDAPMAFNQGCRGMIPGAKLDPVFLFHFLSANTEALNDLGTGTTFKELSATALRSFPVPLPPLDEQKRIVAVLDEAFEGLSRARANAEANLADVDALEASGLIGCFSAKDMDTSLPITEVCDFQGGTQPPKSEFVPELREGYVRLLQIRDFKSDDKAVFIPDRRGLKKCSANDVMIGRYGASVGQILRGKAGAYNVALVRTIPDERRLSKDFLFHFLRSDLFQRPLLEKSSRGAQDGFNKGDLAQIKMPVPPISRQDEICSLLGELHEHVETTRKQIGQSQRELDTLRQSLLQKAFSGELT